MVSPTNLILSAQNPVLWLPGAGWRVVYQVSFAFNQRFLGDLGSLLKAQYIG